MGLHEGEAQPFVLLQGTPVREAPVRGAHHVRLLLAGVHGGLGHARWLPAEGHWQEMWVLSWAGQCPEVDGEASGQGALRPGANLEASLDAEGAVPPSFARLTQRAAVSPKKGLGRVPAVGTFPESKGQGSKGLRPGSYLHWPQQLRQWEGKSPWASFHITAVAPLQIRKTAVPAPAQPSVPPYPSSLPPVLTKPLPWGLLFLLQ